MRNPRRIAVALSLVIALSVILWATSALANAPDPDLYPEEAEAYGRQVGWVLVSVCAALALVGFAIVGGIVLLVVLLTRRRGAATVPQPPGEPGGPERTP